MKTRLERRRQRRLDLLVYILMIVIMTAIVVLLAIWAEKTYGEDKPVTDSVVIYRPDGKALPDYCEAPLEAEIIAMTVEQSIGTEAEIDCIGFDITYVMQVITAEAGHDDELCRACTQALANAVKKLENRFAPDEVCRMYRYANPCSWISDEAYNACVDMFVYGVGYDGIGNATLFYNPMFGLSDYHEEQEFVAEINGVKFYEEVSQ